MNTDFNTQSFQGLKIAKNIYDKGMLFVNREKGVLENLSKDVDVLIKEGTEYSGLYSGPCLKVTVKPIKRTKNPFKRLFNLDCASGIFETELRNIRIVHRSIASLVNNLRGKLPDECFNIKNY